jgi:hypothetical protein
MREEGWQAPSLFMLEDECTEQLLRTEEHRQSGTIFDASQ